MRMFQTQIRNFMNDGAKVTGGSVFLLVQSLMAKEASEARKVLSKSGRGVLKHLSRSTMPSGVTCTCRMYGSSSILIDKA
jgi:hypothetical protein